MAQTSWPFENIDTSETQYSALFSQFQDNGVAGASGGASTLAVSTTTGLGVSVAAGFAIIRGFAYENTSAVDLTLDAADAQNRIDTVILRLDPIANTIAAAVKKGTPGASPSAPALTEVEGGTWEMALADVSVPTGTTALGPANLTDRRAFLGGRVGLWSTSSRPSAPRLSQFGYNTTINGLELWNGTAWVGIGSAIPDGSITDVKLTIPPRRYVSVDNNTGTSLTLTSAYAGAFVRSRNIAGLTVNITTTSLSEGDRVDFVQSNVGAIEFVPGSGVVILSKDAKRKTNGVYAAATLVRMNNGDYLIVGDLAA